VGVIYGIKELKAVEGYHYIKKGQIQGREKILPNKVTKNRAVIVLG